MVNYNPDTIKAVIDLIYSNEFETAKEVISNTLDQWGYDFMPIGSDLVAMYKAEKLLPGNQALYMTVMLSAYSKLDRFIRDNLIESARQGDNAPFWDIVQLLDALTGSHIPCGHFRLLEYAAEEFELGTHTP